MSAKAFQTSSGVDVALRVTNFGRQAVSSIAEIIYSVPAEKTAVIFDIMLCNNQSVEGKISIWLVPSGNSASDENKFINEYQIPSRDFINLKGLYSLSAGDKLVAQAEIDDGITIHLGGVESNG